MKPCKEMPCCTVKKITWFSAPYCVDAGCSFLRFFFSDGLRQLSHRNKRTSKYFRRNHQRKAHTMSDTSYLLCEQYARTVPYNRPLQGSAAVKKINNRFNPIRSSRSVLVRKSERKIESTSQVCPFRLQTTPPKRGIPTPEITTQFLQPKDER